MKFSIVLAAAGLAAAQLDISQIPSCALGCLTTAVASTGCSLTDLSCLCGKKDQLESASKPCIDSKCDAADIAKAQGLANQLCGSSSASGSASSTGSGSTSGTAAPTTTSATITGTGVVPPATTASTGRSTALPGNGTSTSHATSSTRSGSGTATTSGAQTTTSAPGSSGAAGPVAGALAALAAAVFAL
ncbi:Extracellular membrane protein, 8-cysteine region, CFEM [Cordyceps fumosorosea ARSEF 2679]|uniref:Extracellular membrane protein, 8-cysteine region, CFEM n=1 Tax=Cordyceps fumosorosea (strain ARSEF 2679) TaxID=1081104 RepID=A0A168D4R0_CORFA|nr:Extracellular membrane protein, 8-cysteine region, CFEM [Cordyceps fumosorosea ARSEF 2679]OAA72167.1 Extracellular membrane protein, 8-cysteine region, CFEM [Cordyceps fumosorosea ARSEF 2679]